MAGMGGDDDDDGDDGDDDLDNLPDLEQISYGANISSMTTMFIDTSFGNISPMSPKH